MLKKETKEQEDESIVDDLVERKIRCSVDENEIHNNARCCEPENSD